MRHMACHLALMLMPYCPDVVADRVASNLHRLLICGMSKGLWAATIEANTMAFLVDATSR